MMNSTTVRTMRTLALAAPLATAALTLAPAATYAADPGPVIVQPQPGPGLPHGPGDIAQPTPDDDPKGPGDIAQPTPDDDPKGPGDIANPKPGDHPHGPGDLTAPQPCPTHGSCGHDGDGDGDGDHHGDGGNGGRGGHRTDRPDVTSVALPTRIDAGVAAGPRPEESGRDATTLPWLLAGGAAVAGGAAFAVRRRVRA